MIYFGVGEWFEVVIVGDIESFQVDLIFEFGNVFMIKLYVVNVFINMMVIINCCIYFFYLCEGLILNCIGMFFEVCFCYFDEECCVVSVIQFKGFEVLCNYNYCVLGIGDFCFSYIYDDGCYMYFVFLENGCQFVFFKVDDQGCECIVNWIQ